MRYLIILIAISILPDRLAAQSDYDSLTISRFLIKEDMYGAKWQDTLKAGRFSNYITKESKIWDASNRTMKVPAFMTLLNNIKKNGTEDVAKCFIPRHSVNYYKNGNIEKYLLICFECDGFRFSDDPRSTFVKSVSKREEQLKELKVFFKDLL